MACLQDIFHLIVGTFHGLSDTSGPSFGRRVVILETLAKYRSCVVMLDLECDDLVNEMFSTFFAVVRCVTYLFSLSKVLVSTFTHYYHLPKSFVLRAYINALINVEW